MSRAEREQQAVERVVEEALYRAKSDYPPLRPSEVIRIVSGWTEGGQPMSHEDRSLEELCCAIELLGAAYRGDWNDFDGRTLRHQLNDATRLAREGRLDARRWVAYCGVCPENGCWSYHCPDGNWRQCPHVAAILEEGATEEAPDA